MVARPRFHIHTAESKGSGMNGDSYEPTVGELVKGYDERDGVWRRGMFAYHYDDDFSIIEQTVPGDSRVYQVDVERSSLRKPRAG